MDPVTASCCSAVSHFNTNQTRTVTEMTPLSFPATFSALELNFKGGPPDYYVLPFLLLGLQLIFAFSLQQRSNCKRMRHGNWKNNWTFSLAEDGGGCLLEARLCVFGGGRWRRAGGERRAGVGVLGLGGWGCGGVGGVRIAGCGWVCQCHVSSLAPLASRLKDVGPRVWLSLSGFSLNQKWGECCTLLHPVITMSLKSFPFLRKKMMFFLTKVCSRRACASVRIFWGLRII